MSLRRLPGITIACGDSSSTTFMTSDISNGSKYCLSAKCGSNVASLGLLFIIIVGYCSRLNSDIVMAVA